MAISAPPAAPAAPAAAPKPAPAAALAAPKEGADPKPPKEEAPSDPNDIGGLDDIYSDIERLSDEDDAKAEGRAPKGKPKQAKKEDEATEDKTNGEPPEDPAGAKPAAKKEDEPAEPTKIGDLRTAYRELKKWRKENESKISQAQALEAKIKEMETARPPELKTLQERLQAAEKRRDELQAELSHQDYSKDPEYQEKYVLPYQKAWANAIEDLAELEVELPDGQSRKATEKDLVELANMDLGKARAKANELFGDSADDIMAHRREIRRLAKAQEDALEEAKKKSVERADLAKAQAKERTEATHKAWAEGKAEIVKRWPKAFDKVEGDAEGNALLERGQALAESLFAPTEENRPRTQEEAIKRHAKMYHMIRNHDRLGLWLKKANARIKELESSLAEYESSDPNGGLGDGARHTGGSGEEDPNAEIDRLDREA